MGARSISTREVTDAESWDDTLLALPDAHVLQSWAWGSFKGRHGWSATRLLFERDDRPVAAASVLHRKLPRLPVSILYVSKGPALDWTDADLTVGVLAELERFARRRKALFIKIDPDITYPDESGIAGSSAQPPPAHTGNGSFVPETGQSRPTCAPQVAGMLTERGWRLSDEQIQFRNTVLLDLSRPEEELLAAMKQKTRYNVRLAVRKGVSVRSGSEADLATFYELYSETAKRDGFLIRPFDYYLDAWGSFMDQGLAHLLLAEVEGEATAGLILFTLGPTAWYMYGASSNRHRKAMPNNLLQWEAMLRAKAAGCRLYDLWGAPDTLDESDPMWGVVRFKLGLGGQVSRGLGAWDYAVNGPAYRLYRASMPYYLNWMRRRAGTGASTAG